MFRMRETMRWTTLILPLVALGLSVTGCATIRAHQTAETEQILSAAGFQVQPADTPEKLAHLQTLTPWTALRDGRDGQPQYVYADPETCKCLYVGDEQRYQKYQKLSLQKKIADEQLSAGQGDVGALLIPPPTTQASSTGRAAHGDSMKTMVIVALIVLSAAASVSPAAAAIW